MIKKYIYELLHILQKRKKNGNVNNNNNKKKTILLRKDQYTLEIIL